MNKYYQDIDELLNSGYTPTILTMFYISYDIYHDVIVGDLVKPDSDEKYLNTKYKCEMKMKEEYQHLSLVEYMNEAIKRSRPIFNFNAVFETDEDIETMIKAIETYSSFAIKRFFVDCDDTLSVDGIFRLSQSKLYASCREEEELNLVKPYDFKDYASFLKDTGFNEERLYMFMQRNRYWFERTQTPLAAKFTMFEKTEYQMTISMSEWQTAIFNHSFNGKYVSPFYYLMYRQLSPYTAEIFTVNDIFYMKQNDEEGVIIGCSEREETEELSREEAEERLDFIRQFKTTYELYFPREEAA